MCGIVGYVGPQDAAPILLQGLGRLEYRGYDSAGIAVCTRSGLKVRKAKGRVADLAADLPARFKGSPGIGHTRWATHGEPTVENAHPQVDAAQRIAVVHNGIIENADELRAKLSADGVEFTSQTDTETVAHLVAKAFVDGADRPGAGRAAGAALRRRRLRAGHHGRRGARPHRRRPQRQPRAAGHRREGDVRRLRRRRADRLHPPGRLPRRRRARHHHRERLPHLHDRRPLDGQEPVHDRLGRRRRRDRRPRALPHQGDRRAAAHDLARVLRPHRRALRHRPARRPQPLRPGGPRDQAREDPRLRLGLLRGRPRRAAHRGPRPHARHLGGGVGVPLPQPGGRAGHALHRGQPVRRDHRHPRRGAGAAAQGRPGDRHRQRGRLHDRPPGRRRHLHPRGPGDVGGGHEVVHQHGDGVRAARAVPGPHARPRARPRASASWRGCSGCRSRSRRSSTSPRTSPTSPS